MAALCELLGLGGVTLPPFPLPVLPGFPEPPPPPPGPLVTMEGLAPFPVGTTTVPELIVDILQLL